MTLQGRLNCSRTARNLAQNLCWLVCDATTNKSYRVCSSDEKINIIHQIMRHKAPIQGRHHGPRPRASKRLQFW